MTNQEKNLFFTQDDLPIFDLSQIYMVSSSWFDTGMADVWATFDIIVRDMPPKRNFLIAAGLEEMIKGIQSWRYKDHHIKLLAREKLISPAFGRYLKRFRFHGDIDAITEGTVFFPQEPVIRITAPIIEANLFTAFLINIISSNVPTVSKFVRSVVAANGKSVIGLGPQRCLSFEATLKGQRSTYIAGSNNVPSPFTRLRLGIGGGDHATIGYHAFITSYATESEAMHALGESADLDFSLMVDTYDVNKGLTNAIKVAKKLKNQGKKLKAVVLDSGNLLKLSQLARNKLDRAGLKEVKITVASNINEYRLAKLIKAKIPADTFIVCTEAATIPDAPGLEVVYKMSEIIDDNGRHPKMKFSTNKISLPGQKQVYRIKKGGVFAGDIIGLANENVGHALLKPIFKNGRLVYKIPELKTIRQKVKREMKLLPKRYLSINREYKYPVKLSSGLKKLIKKLERQHKLKA
ncbi:nicotinate phosphoribosyltransferase [Patescibacteria group bacterium]